MVKVDWDGGASGGGVGVVVVVVVVGVCVWGGGSHPNTLQENLKSPEISEEKSTISEYWEKKKIDSSSAVSAFF